MNFRRQVLGVVMVALGATGSAQADQLSFQGLTGGGVALRVNHSGGSINTWAGRFEWHNATTGDDIVSYCIELTQFTPQGFGEYTETSLGSILTTARAEALAELFEDHGAQSLAFSSPGDETDLTEAAAMQMAVWEIVSETAEGTWNVLAGSTSFQSRSGTNSQLFGAALSLAQNWLNALDGTFDPASLDRIVAITSDGNQDQIIMVPLPPPLAFASLGILGVIAARRRSHRR
jgi:hypothetical protein